MEWVLNQSWHLENSEYQKFYYNLVGLYKTKQHACFYSLKPPSGKVNFFVILVFTGTTKERQVKQFG